MSRRPLRHRVATVLLGLLYLLAWGEPVALHPCPMHDGAAAAVVAGGEHGGMHAAGHATAAADAGGHAAHAAVQDAAPSGDHDAGHACQCLGAGCSTGAVALATAQHVRWFAVVTRRADPPAPALAPPPAHAPRHRLPPATGPPALG